jgi:hypothetical protein
MTYTVTIHWTSTSIEHVKGLSRAAAQALADHTVKLYPALVVTIEKG